MKNTNIIIALMLLLTPATAFGSKEPLDVVVLAISTSESFSPGLTKLRYSEKDAERFAEVMSSIGRVPADRIIIQHATDSKSLQTAILKVNKLLSECELCSKKFIFYYSGHSDEGGLHLHDGLLGKSQLHDTLAQVKAETKVVFIDSCFSGALTKKGVRPAPVFELPKAEFDEPSGSIFLSASSGNEFSYESKSLGGSIFTHFLVAGLAGEADTSDDGVITVDEVYQYVYRSAKLESLLFPASERQTPEFVSRLEGRGAVTLTFPAETNSRLVLSSDLGGQILIAGLSGVQLFKVDKPIGTPKLVQLPPGKYLVTVSQGPNIGKMDVNLNAQNISEISGHDMKWTSRAPVGTAKGSIRTGSDLTAAMGYREGYVGNQLGGASARFFWHPLNYNIGGFAFHLGPDLGLERLNAVAESDVATITNTNLGLTMKAVAPFRTWSPSFISSFGANGMQQRWEFSDGTDSKKTALSGFARAGLVFEFNLPNEKTIGLSIDRMFISANDTVSGRRILAANAISLLHSF